MTLLANDATSDARKILKKYGKPDAQDHEDLEVKLSQLYIETQDKRALEKDMADIHPHKKWLLKYVAPPVEVVKKEEVKIEAIPEPIKEVVKQCGCPRCMNFEGYHSSFEGTTNTSPTKDNTTVIIAALGIVGIIAILSMKK